MFYKQRWHPPRLSAAAPLERMKQGVGVWGFCTWLFLFLTESFVAATFAVSSCVFFSCLTVSSWFLLFHNATEMRQQRSEAGRVLNVRAQSLSVVRSILRTPKPPFFCWGFGGFASSSACSLSRCSICFAIPKAIRVNIVREGIRPRCPSLASRVSLFSCI